ncbi:RNA-binding motif X-linked 2 [Brachionus plicatilis]|uniref:RNA-binding motif X-linked 2 n=1 Tax=Brachionus plicatilis TaxID=10195 RepID=A0A3M7SMJ5_BRAPC|nr:RNA-binding motif X-linked 2 [Brachionus plicatilis]
MNPLTQTKNLQKLIENELKLGAVGTTKSWHNQYRDSAWVFYGGMPYELTEGDIVCVFSQYGEVVNINLIRDRKTGKSKGFGFVCYENQKSTDLAVDNFNGTKILGRIIKVDHAGNYKPPKEYEDADEITKFLRESGCQGELHQIEEQNDKKVQKEIKSERDDGSRHDDRQRKKSRSRSREKEKRRERDLARDRSRERHKKRSRSRGRDRSRDRHRRDHHKKDKY